MRIKFPFKFSLYVDPAKPYGMPVAHSPERWPWWKLFAFSFVTTNPHIKKRAWCWSYNLWLYSRGNAQCTWVCFKKDWP